MHAFSLPAAAAQLSPHSNGSPIQPRCASGQRYPLANTHPPAPCPTPQSHLLALRKRDVQQLAAQHLAAHLGHRTCRLVGAGVAHKAKAARLAAHVVNDLRKGARFEGSGGQQGSNAAGAHLLHCGCMQPATRPRSCRPYRARHPPAGPAGLAWARAQLQLTLAAPCMRMCVLAALFRAAAHHASSSTARAQQSVARPAVAHRARALWLVMVP